MGTWLRGRLTFANVVSIIALFIALGGGAYAVSTAPKNSVVSKSIKNGQVKPPDLSPETSISFHAVEASEFGEEALGCQWLNTGEGNPAGYRRDGYGIVHLQGRIRWQAWPGHVCAVGGGSLSTSTIFTLPAGLRPANEELQAAPANGRVVRVRVAPDGTVHQALDTVADGDASAGFLSLDGITFRCAPSGQDGCP